MKKKYDKVVQDSYRLTLLNITLSSIRLNRVEYEDYRKNRNVHTSWQNLPSKMPVCKATFIKVLGEF